jgi:hypothetical protein
MLLCAENEGYFTYTEDTDTWAPASVSGGPAPGDHTPFEHVMVWKNRVWLVEKESGNAWYTDVGSFEGPLTRFSFGNKFRYGGELVALYNWTFDSGFGPDDFLVAVSAGGDVMAYQGTDPSNSSTFGLIGGWFIGPTPAGRRVADEFGGDLHILSTYGLTSMASLMKGMGDTATTNVSSKISRFISSAMAARRNDRGWEVRLHPTVNSIVILDPADIQYVYNTETRGWSIWRNVPMLSSDEWHGNFYFGTADNRVFQYTDYLDNVLIPDPTETVAVPDPVPISFSLLTSYQDFGESAVFKRIQYVRPVWISSGQPSYTATPRYEYSLAEAAQPGIIPSTSDSAWDVAIWDDAVWGGAAETSQQLLGGSGMGRVVSIAIRGRVVAQSTLVSIDIMWDSGGYL